MNIKQTTIILISCFFVVACTYNKDELPKPDDTLADGPTRTYTSHAKAILDAKCVICHSAGGTNQSPFLDTYSAAFAKKARIEARAIIQGTMPQAGPLPQTEKDTLQMWIDQGALQ